MQEYPAGVIFGLLLTSASAGVGREGWAMLLGILGTTAVGAVFGLVSWMPQSYRLGDMAATAGKLDIGAAWKLGLLEVVFVFLFVDVFDNVGTLAGSEQEGWAVRFDEAHPTHAKGSCWRMLGDYGWIAGRDLDRGQLHRKCGGRRVEEDAAASRRS